MLVLFYSLAVEPLYPQVGQQVPVCVPVEETNIISPVELSRRLNALPCALSFHRDELPSLLHLMLKSRWSVSTQRTPVLGGFSRFSLRHPTVGRFTLFAACVHHWSNHMAYLHHYSFTLRFADRFANRSSRHEYNNGQKLAQVGQRSKKHILPNSSEVIISSSLFLDSWFRDLELWF